MMSCRLLQLSRQSRTLQNSVRSFSSECAPAQKLKEVFEDYRKAHFSRELPSRFRKELVKSIESEGVVKKDSLNQILINIGKKDKMLTDEEYALLVKEAGDERALTLSKMMRLF